MKYWQRVKVTSWFYEWMKWIVISESIIEQIETAKINQDIIKQVISYQCELIAGPQIINSSFIPESQLEIIK